MWVPNQQTFFPRITNKQLKSETMKTYWDHSNQERANLKREDVERLLDFELMEKGVLKPQPPKLAEIQKSPAGERTNYYTLSVTGKYGSSEHLSVCFETIEAANAFLGLKPFVRDYEYEIGSDHPYSKPVNPTAIEVEPLYTQEAIVAFKSQLKDRKAAIEHNAKLTAEYNKAVTEADKVTEGVWSDWHDQVDIKNKCQRVVNTYLEYLKMTEGNIQLAVKFLEKAHTCAVVNSAREWFPDQIPTPAVQDIETAAEQAIQ